MASDGHLEIDDPRDLQIQQLQRALETRIVIEQAKGMLAERFGLDIDDSFELLRHAARSHQQKVQALAAEIIQTRATPLAIVDALVRIGHPHNDDFKQRALRAEQMFADLNDALIAIHRETPWTKFVCECSNPLCGDQVTLSPESLALIHSRPGRYVLRAGHQVDEVDTVIDQIDGLVIVEKRAATRT